MTDVFLMALALAMDAAAASAAIAPAKTGWMALVALAVATRIDALGAGLTLPEKGPSLAVSAGTIGAVTLLLSLAAGAVGRTLGQRLGSLLRAFGGLLLVGLGIAALFR